MAEDLITRGEAIALLAGEQLRPHGNGRGAYWRWYQRLERERATGRLAGHQRDGRRGVLFARADVLQLRDELVDAGVRTPASRRRAKAATRTRMEARGLVPLPVAAERLGLKPGSLRSRLQRGTIAGERIDGQWFLTPEVVAAALPATRAPRSGSVRVRCALCGSERDTTRRRADAAERHFCSEAHRLEWFTREVTAGRITRRGRPDGPLGRERKSAAMRRQWEQGERDVEQIRALGSAAQWTRAKRFADRIDKMTRTRYGHGLSAARKAEIANRALSRSQRQSPRSRAAAELRERLTELWAAGLTVREIAEQLGTTESYVKVTRRRLGLPQRTPGPRRR